MKNITTNAPYVIDCANMKIKVFRTGSTPRLARRNKSSADPEMLRGIHNHFTYEAFFVTDGELELVTDEYSHVYGRTILIIPPKLRHYTLARAGESFCLLFSLESSTPDASALRAMLDEGVCTLPISDDVSFYINKVAEKTECKTCAADRDAELLCSLIFREMLDSLLPKRTSRTTALSSEHISNIEAYINANLLSKITLSDVAASVHLSSKQISRIIEREYGCTFVELLTQKRLATAEMLLKNTDMKISDIAAQTFGSSEAYFYTVFKKNMGTTPRKYRKESHIYK